MTVGEAKIVCNIMAGADGGCASCASSLLEEFIENFPQFKDEAMGAFIERYDWATPQDYFDFLKEKEKGG